MRAKTRIARIVRKKMPYKTTKKDFEEFTAEAQKWSNYFGMSDWEIIYLHDDQQGVGDNRASCYVDYNGKIASIYLACEWNIPPYKGVIKKVAFHEIVEVLISPLRVMAQSRYVTSDEIDVANHYIVRILENCVFWRIYKNDLVEKKSATKNTKAKTAKTQKR